jgi:hypothetical protein
MIIKCEERKLWKEAVVGGPIKSELSWQNQSTFELDNSWTNYRGVFKPAPGQPF